MKNIEFEEFAELLKQGLSEKVKLEARIHFDDNKRYSFFWYEGRFSLIQDFDLRSSSYIINLKKGGKIIFGRDSKMDIKIDLENNLLGDINYNSSTIIIPVKGEFYMDHINNIEY
jgi:hypothetical protein